MRVRKFASALCFILLGPPVGALAGKAMHALLPSGFQPVSASALSSIGLPLQVVFVYVTGIAPAVICTAIFLLLAIALPRFQLSAVAFRVVVSLSGALSGFLALVVLYLGLSKLMRAGAPVWPPTYGTAIFAIQGIVAGLLCGVVIAWQFLASTDRAAGQNET